MTARGAVRDLILIYLRVDDQPAHIYGLFDYMAAHKVREGAVREQLRRLVKDGTIERLERGLYKIKGA